MEANSDTVLGKNSWDEEDDVLQPLESLNFGASKDEVWKRLYYAGLEKNS